MKVLFTFRSLAVWGGIERVLVDKMNHLVTMYGYDVYMLTTGQGSHPVPYRLAEGVHIEDLGVQFHLQYQYGGFRRLWDGHQRTRLFEQRLARRLREIRPDVIVCTTADPVNSIVKVKGSVPLVVESHSICSRTLGEKGLRQRYVAHLLRKGLRKAACVVALSEGDAVAWRRLHPWVEMIPDTVHLNDGAHSPLTDRRVLFVGRFDYQKRPLEAVRIWQMVYPQFPDWHLDLYGEGEQLQALLQEANAVGMNIHVHKPTAGIFDCYRGCSIVVSTSLYEPFGLVIPEAMSCGVPVVAYNCPFGPSSVIADGENGFLVDNDDRQSFARRLMMLMNDASLRQRLGEAAVETSRRFSADIVMPQWKRLFETIVSQ